MKENEDYELIPGEGENWDVRILTGEFIETIINFKELRVTDDAEHLSFNFGVVSSPDPELNNENIDLQTIACMVLSDVLENAIVRNKEEK